jgi:hypothetical protein
MNIKQLTSTDIHPLYLRCIKRNDDGTFADLPARGQLADLAWGMIPLRSYLTFGLQKIVKGVPMDFAVTYHNIYGRHAPLVSLDAANCVGLHGLWYIDQTTEQDDDGYDCVDVVVRSPSGVLKAKELGQ